MHYACRRVIAPLPCGEKGGRAAAAMRGGAKTIGVTKCVTRNTFPGKAPALKRLRAESTEVEQRILLASSS